MKETLKQKVESMLKIWEARHLESKVNYKHGKHVDMLALASSEQGIIEEQTKVIDYLKELLK